MSKPIRAVVVDDSALMRVVLREILNSAPDIEVAGVASDPFNARQIIRELSPDVITLDVEMPRMNGLDFLEKLMRLKPTPVVMISSLTEVGSDITLRALELGAVDFVTKPKADLQRSMLDYAETLIEKIRAASRARVRRLESPPDVQTGRIAVKTPPQFFSTEKLIAIGASTGGTEAIREVLRSLPADTPGILIAQHMPEQFTAGFARRLNEQCRMVVKEAEHGERVLPGYAYIAPGHSHLKLKRSGANYLCELDCGEKVNHHRPSVDVLFNSVARTAGPNAVAALLTGMGKDGALGMLNLRQSGAHTIGQDEATCVVYGMPREAAMLGATELVLPLEQIASQLITWINVGQRAVRI
ncbi:chemotaxis response regulator protein-glutamate methylesterase [Chitinivorax sp. B]|uniref:protein-glutamate methylesterase/protein-glutamine glutaminase n=1 Tax=Chitinivorax sp. B TaxID=2502235 RepID=UPI0010F79069|nr:chemotaxis response regulator protein-glutamate methylesterase [Chitinivorax sp. B]